MKLSKLGHSWVIAGVLVLPSCSPTQHASQPHTSTSDNVLPGHGCSTVPALDPGISKPEVVSRVFPQVPPNIAREMGAWACAEATVTVQGTLSDIRIVKASHPVWGRNTLEALKQWKYKPALRDGHAIEVRINIATTMATDQMR